MELSNLIDWESILFRYGFGLLESSTSTYGNGRFTGSIICEEFINREWRIVDESDKKRGIARLIFCPFIKAINEFKPNTKYQTVKIRTEADLQEYIYQTTDKSEIIKCDGCGIAYKEPNPSFEFGKFNVCDNCKTRTDLHFE